jgi:hypothetical protein
MWEPVRSTYLKLFETAANTVSILKEIRESHANISEQLTQVVYRLVLVAANTCGAIQILVLNGYGADALRLSRSVYETELNIVWLRDHPEDVLDFVEYRAIQRKHYYDAMDEKRRKLLPAEVCEEILAEYAAALPRFATKSGKPRNEWCRVSLRERAKAAGFLDLHGVYYRLASSVHHGDITGLRSQTDLDGKTDMAPSWSNLGNALVSGVASFVRCLSYLDDLDEIAALGFKDRIESLNMSYVAALRSLSSDASTTSLP